LKIIQQGKLNPEPIKRLSAILSKGQGGLLDILLHPKYKQNG
jgi:glucose/arabinose dehydrogenase